MCSLPANLVKSAKAWKNPGSRNQYPWYPLLFTLETASMWWSFPQIEFRVLLSHPMGAPIPKGSWSHHLPAVTPLSPIHRLLRVVVAPSLSMSLPMNFLSM